MIYDVGLLVWQVILFVFVLCAVAIVLNLWFERQRLRAQRDKWGAWLDGHEEDMKKFYKPLDGTGKPD